MVGLTHASNILVNAVFSVETVSEPDRRHLIIFDSCYNGFIHSILFCRSVTYYIHDLF